MVLRYTKSKGGGRSKFEINRLIPEYNAGIYRLYNVIVVIIVSFVCIMWNILKTNNSTKCLINVV